jgi:hypothetical protein
MNRQSLAMATVQFRRSKSPKSSGRRRRHRDERIRGASQGQTVNIEL